MTIKVTCINGSPRPRGVTSRFLEICERAVNQSSEEMEIHTLIPSKKKVMPCTHCDSCIETGYCAFKDKDDVQNMYDVINDSDLLYIGTPVYFAGAPGAFKSFIDRAQVFWNRRYVRREEIPVRISRAIVVATCGSRGKSMFDGLFQTMYYFLDSLGIKLLRERDMLAYRRMEQPDDIKAEVAQQVELFVREAAQAIAKEKRPFQKGKK
ncbi:MAG: flavodoxin family protein [Planctomycetota bacterium]|nr:MAG: flavodoxin family protein [Planctomycetota bacterium]